MSSLRKLVPFTRPAAFTVRVRPRGRDAAEDGLFSQLLHVRLHSLRAGCPTGAIKPLSQMEKKLIQIGKAHFTKEDCIVETKKTDCGACSEHCPTKAVRMVLHEVCVDADHRRSGCTQEADRRRIG